MEAVQSTQDLAVVEYSTPRKNALLKKLLGVEAVFNLLQSRQNLVIRLFKIALDTRIFQLHPVICAFETGSRGRDSALDVTYAAVSVACS